MIRVKRLHRDVILPTKKHEEDAGFDLHLHRIVTRRSGREVTYGTGLAFEIPEGHVGLIFERSSTAKNTKLSLMNKVGVIDSNYRGEVLLPFSLSEDGIDPSIYLGMRVVQLLVLEIPNYPLVEVEELQESDRGEKGFGSTGSI